MSAFLQQEGLKALNDAKTALMHNGGGSAEWYVRLFKNNHTCALGDILADFTEADFSGYAAQRIGAFGSSTYSTGIADALASTPLTWTNTTGVTGNSIYGVFVTDSGATKLYYSENPPAVPIAMTVAGDSLTYTPAMSEQNA